MAMLFVGCGLLTAQCAGLQAQVASSQAGVSADQLRSFAQQLPSEPARIQSLQILQSGQGPLIGVARFSASDGWELSVYGATSEGKFVERWHSGKLADSFRVSYPNALKTFSFGNEDGVEFEGCAPHSCPEVFSILLYVPSISKDFVVTSTFGKTAYSQEALLPQNLRYKQALDQLLKEH
ncbi:hypothetical protein [Granulicella sp. 5B5]|uniref:hypothetical protein n=1 Tax=Granulicella sp. 5B5 TaxID=1617967 RepID=UPI001C70B30F|nr:hypothetical protein [Granulicella sp. 5B5]